MSYGGAARRCPEQVDRHHVQLNRRVPARADERKEPTTALPDNKNVGQPA
jgi:hypothetical protein